MSEIQASDSYHSIAGPSSGIYKELGSKFLSFAYPVSNEEQVKGIVADLKKEFFDARHHCYAYRLGPSGEQWRANDDGEPSSSAGRPILGQLLSYGLSDVLIVVVRYFGGTKLGIPGLIRAYKGAASDALSNARIVEKINSRTLIVSFDYINMEPVMKIVKNLNPEIIDQTFDIRCSFRLSIRETMYEELSTALSNVEGAEMTENI